MCGSLRLDIQVTAQVLVKHYGLSRLPKGVFHGKRGADQVATVVAKTREGRVADGLRWGIHPSFAQERGNIFLNARLDTITRSLFGARETLWQEAIRLGQTCVVPMSAFFEVSAMEGYPRGVRAVMVTPGPEPVFSAAGIWGLDSSDGKPSFVVVTVDSDADLSIHHHRMPLLLTRDGVDRWLSMDKNTNPMEFSHRHRSREYVIGRDPDTLPRSVTVDL